MRITPILLLVCFFASAQDINAEYDKKRDFSKYKTFSIGEGEVITPKDDQRFESSALKKGVIDAVTRELTGKGLQKMDSAADLVLSFVIGSEARSDMEQLGGGGMMPGSTDRTWSREYRMGSLIIDLNDKNDNLIWRITSTTRDSVTDAQGTIEQIVAAGFKKFSLKPKKVKNKKK